MSLLKRIVFRVEDRQVIRHNRHLYEVALNNNYLRHRTESFPVLVKPMRSWMGQPECLLLFSVSYPDLALGEAKADPDDELLPARKRR